jgi:hypothetical protein
MQIRNKWNRNQGFKLRIDQYRGGFKKVLAL